MKWSEPENGVRIGVQFLNDLLQQVFRVNSLANFILDCFSLRLLDPQGFLVVILVSQGPAGDHFAVLHRLPPLAEILL